MTIKSNIDLVLINPGNRKQAYQSLGENLAAIEPPVWAGLIAEFVRRKGFSVVLLDANALGLSPEETAQQVEEISPTLVAVVVYGHQPSASTQNMPVAGAVCTAIKNRTPECKVLLVGGHVTSLPERTLREEDADFVSNGEGLYTIVDLIQCLRSNCPDEYSKVRGLHYLQDDSMLSTPGAPLLLEIDEEMPMMAWDLFPMDQYRAHNWHCFGHLQRQPYASIYTTLGCPFHCTFCCIQAPFKDGEKNLDYKESVNSYRLWNPDKVIDQIDLLVNKYGVKNFKFADEMFVLNRRHVEGICDRIIERGYDLNIWAYARVDTIKDGMLEKLKKAGFNWLALGIESANDRVLADIRKGIKGSNVEQVIKQIQAEGINVIGNYIFGLPEDDLESMQQTLDLALLLNAEFANFYCAMAYPGSDLYNIAIQEGWPLPKIWNGYSHHSYDTLPLPTKYLSASEVLRFRDDAFQKYFTHEPYLEMTTQKFGINTTTHIKDMVSHKLERKYA
jgi:radical SAM superfamily enzyme YgiQ (UPF0313 family)